MNLLILLLSVGIHAQGKTETAPSGTKDRGDLIVPGSGEGTEDPQTVLLRAGESVRRIRNLSYSAVYKGDGAMATRSPVAVGQVTLSRLPAGNPFMPKLAARGEYFASGSADKVPFHTTFDGLNIRRLRFLEKAVVTKQVSLDDPKERTLGFVTSFFGGGPYQLLMLELLQNEPLRRQAAAPVTNYEGRTSVGGVLCHVVYVELPKDARGRIPKERWYLGVADNLPRRLEQIQEDNEGRYGSYSLTLSDLKHPPTVLPRTFAASVPAGYVVKPAADKPKPPLLEVGATAPDWSLMDADGTEQKLSRFRGKWVVVDFWATWCGPCIAAMPELQKLHDAYKNRGVVVFGINVWEDSNSVAFFRKHAFSYGLLLNGEQPANAYGVSSLPTLYVVDPEGKIVRRTKGLDVELARFIDSQLGSK